MPGLTITVTRGACASRPSASTSTPTTTPRRFAAAWSPITPTSDRCTLYCAGMPLSRPETDAPGAPDGRPAALARGAAQAVHAALREAKRAKAKKQATNMLLELLKEWPRARLKGAAKRKPVKHKPVKRGVTPRSTSTSRPSPYPRDGGRVCVGFLVRRRYRSSIAGQRTPRPLDECASNARSASRWRRCLGTAPPHSIHFPVDERQHPKRQQAFEKISSREFHEGPEYFPRHKCKLGSSDASRRVFPPGASSRGPRRAQHLQ